MGRFRRWTILGHRYLGIALCGLFAMWFLSGIGMVFAGGMPGLSMDERLQRMLPLDFSRIRLSASDAAARAGRSRSSGQVRMLSVMGRPAYRFTTAPSVTVFADDGEELQEIGDARSLEIASQFQGVPVGSLRYIALQAADQWTIAARASAPFHKIRVNDSPRTELYVSASLGEVVVKTTRAGRALAWIAAIPHWLYFAPLRLHARAWSIVVLWASGLGIITAAAGLVLGALQYRVHYAGLMRWHYMSGVAFGGFALTWVFSGFLSMQPGNWASAHNARTHIGESLSGGALDLTEFPRLSDREWQNISGPPVVREMELSRIQGRPYYIVRGVGAAQVIAANPVAARAGGFSLASINARLRDGYPGARMVESQLLRQYDSYYYDRNGRAALPVLRAKFGDPQQTWIYVDPVTSQVVAELSRGQRLERWLYHGFHSLDFPFLYYRRSLWAAGVIALCLGGFILSSIGAIMGFRRLRRSTRAILEPPQGMGVKSPNHSV